MSASLRPGCSSVRCDAYEPHIQYARPKHNANELHRTQNIEIIEILIEVDRCLVWDT